jgi:ubiquitin-protein ligase
MDLARVNREVEEARKSFPNIECHPTSNGSVYVLAALQTSTGRLYTLSVTFPDNYPNSPAQVLIRKPELSGVPPHRYNSGHICYILPKVWNPGRHDLTFVIARAAKWLAKYEVWAVTSRWPGAGLAH